MQSEKVNLMDFLSGKSKLGEIKKIIIPDVQRDYVLGSGGEKLVGLFKEMNKHEEEFNFSCIMGYKDSRTNIFYIYDGQQRLVTLLYLAAYLSNIEIDSSYIKQINKFSFTERKSANEYLISLLEGKKTDVPIEDYTTFSIKNLIDEYKQQKYVDELIKKDNININFLMEKVYFEVVPVKIAGDAEQFFMDLNDGLDLEDYEIFKAELNHIISEMDSKLSKKFSLALENRWLKFFMRFSTNDLYEEEIEVNFIKYCLRMIFIEEYGNDFTYEENNLQWLKKDNNGFAIIDKIYTIIENVVSLDINDTEIANCIFYSFGERMYNDDIDEVNGTFWRLDNNDFESMLAMFINNISDKENTKRDVLIWSYISNLDKEKSVLDKYLRFIKKILNHNLSENNVAYYDKNNKIWFAKYYVYGIPKYYSGITRHNKNQNQDNYLLEIVNINKYFTQTNEFDISKFIEVSKNIEVKSILKKELLKYQYNAESEIYEFENLPFINGLIYNFVDEDNRLVVKYNDLKEELAFRKDAGRSDRNMVNEIYKKLSGNINSDYVFMANVNTFKWRAYTGNISKVKHKKVLFQCLVDIFITTDMKERKLLKDFLTNNWRVSDSLQGVQSYYRFYKYLPKGWKDDTCLISYPDDFYTYASTYDTDKTKYRGLCSLNGDTPLIKIRNMEEWLEESTYRIVLNGNSEIEVSLKGSIKDVNRIHTIRNCYKWLRDDLFIGESYKEILYTDNPWYINIILESYLSNYPDERNSIQTWIKNTVVLPVFGNYYLLNSYQLNNAWRKVNS